MTSFEIDDAGPGDLPVLQAVYRRSSLSNARDREHLLAHPDALELSDLAVREGRTRAAAAAGQIIGFASWLRVADAVEVEDLFVDPDWMGQGVGLALLQDLIALARGHEARRVQVTANPEAVPFYEKAGFTAGHEVATRFGPAPRLQLELT